MYVIRTSEMGAVISTFDLLQFWVVPTKKLGTIPTKKLGTIQAIPTKKLGIVPTKKAALVMISKKNDL